MTKRQCLRVLIAEDIQDAARMLVELLRLEGHSVRVAEDGEEALNLAHLTQPYEPDPHATLSRSGVFQRQL